MNPAIQKPLNRDPNKAKFKPFAELLGMNIKINPNNPINEDTNLFLVNFSPENNHPKKNMPKTILA